MKQSILLILTVTSLFLSFAAFAQEEPETTPAPTPNGPPEPAKTIKENDLTLELLSDRLPQGRAGLIHLNGPGIDDAWLRFQDQQIEMFPVSGDGFYGLIAASMDQAIHVYELTVFVELDDGTRTVITTDIEVANGGFIQQPVVLREDQEYLIDPEIELTELGHILDITRGYTTERLWDESGFMFPLESELTSPFGAVRTFNNTLQSRHTGWDFRAQVGEPMVAAARGRVVFAGQVDIRGNYVLIDHGYGIYSGYAHLSVIHVTQGQLVSKGQVIGQVGDTGRSAGAHAHLDFIVNGDWVDGADFINMWIP